MPLVNSMGVLRNMSMFNTITPIGAQQWIAQYSTIGDAKDLLGINSSGDIYVVDSNSYGLFKINNSGSKVYSFYTSDRFNAGGEYICLDSTGNIYVGGVSSVAPNEFPAVIKYDSSGNILWQVQYKAYQFNSVLSLIIAPTGDLFMLTGSSTGGSPASPFLSGPYTLFRIDSNTGAIINQRRVLKQATSAPSDLMIDSVNNKLVVTGTDYSGAHSTIINGYYDFTNTDTASGMTIQSSTVDDYETFFGGRQIANCVTDGTYIYMIAWRVISGITRSVYMRINRASGSVSYSNAIIIAGSSTTITGITKDTSGFLYVQGYWAGGTGKTYVAKIDASTGSVIWCKTIGTTTAGEGIGNILYSSGFLYFNATYNSGGVRSSTIKLNSNGSLPDGTYGTYWTFATVTPSLVSYMPQTTGSATGSNLTTTYATQTSGFTKTTDTTTISTINIP